MQLAVECKGSDSDTNALNQLLSKTQFRQVWLECIELPASQQQEGNYICGRHFLQLCAVVSCCTVEAHVMRFNQGPSSCKHHD